MFFFWGGEACVRDVELLRSTPRWGRQRFAATAAAFAGGRLPWLSSNTMPWMRTQPAVLGMSRSGLFRFVRLEVDGTDLAWLSIYQGLRPSTRRTTCFFFFSADHSQRPWEDCDSAFVFPGDLVRQTEASRSFAFNLLVVQFWSMFRQDPKR